jgi:hypothetical protein
MPRSRRSPRRDSPAPHSLGSAGPLPHQEGDVPSTHGEIPDPALLPVDTHEQFREKAQQLVEAEPVVGLRGAAGADRLAGEGLVVEQPARAQGGGNGRGEGAVEEVGDEDQVEARGLRGIGLDVAYLGIDGETAAPRLAAQALDGYRREVPGGDRKPVLR